MIDLKLIKKISIDNHIPIMRDKTIEFLFNLLKEKKPSNILEIGSGNGYSAQYLAKYEGVNKIISLEKNENNFKICNLYKNDKISFINIDCFEFFTNNKFDLIILDGPKSKQDVLFNKYSCFLKKEGLIFIDNIFLKKFNNKLQLNKNQIKLMQNIKKFNDFLLNLDKEKWDVQIFDIDDGFAIIKEKNNEYMN